MYEEENIEPEFLKRQKKNPFRTPDHYFDSIEDRVMGAIEYEAKNKTTSKSGKIIQLLKPVLGLAASFAIVYLLAYYPIKYFSPSSLVKSEITDSSSFDNMDAYALNFSLFDENSLFNTILGDETSALSEIKSDELLAYLSTDMNDLEIYSEIQN
ncbi:MAG: hypothetical protein Q8K69_04430 [Bacteroidota bacterium]|nr:hypothetical protein [Bacteroidota bacterium]MDP3913925.1 hypothetical protein [Bacteroidota bacterium]